MFDILSVKFRVNILSRSLLNAISNSLNLSVNNHDVCCLFVLFYLILYVPSTIFQLNRDGSFWVEPVLSYDNHVCCETYKLKEINSFNLTQYFNP